MANDKQAVSLDELSDINRQCASLHKDWQQFYQLASAQPDTNDEQRQLAYIQLQSRFSCDYPILSQWRKGNFGLASSIGKLVANAGTLESFAKEAQAGDGPLVREWKEVNDSIVQVRTHLATAQEQAKNGKPVNLPKEITPPKERAPLPVEWMLKKLRTACIVLACCVAMFFILRPVFVHTGLLAWLDGAYIQWQIRNGIDGLDIGRPSLPRE